MFYRIGYRPSHAPRTTMLWEPTTILAIGTLVGSALSAVSAIREGNAAKATANLQAGISQQKADSERNQSAADERDFRANQSRVLAARRAALGGSGTRQDVGSNLLVAEDFASEAELQALRIRGGGEIRATRAEQQAKLTRFKGSQAQTSGFLRGGSLLISGGAKSFGQFKGI